MKKSLRSSELNNLYLAALLLSVVLAAGVTGYRAIEGFSWLDSLYMTVITLATVGFKEIQPLSDAGKIFTIILIVSSFGIFAYVITTITRFIIDGGMRNYYLQRKINKMIQHTSKHVIICGYGRNGSQACREFTQRGQPFIVIESKESVIDRMREDGIELFVHGDATNDSVLEQAGVATASALITSLPSDADNTFVVLTARHMNPELTIISRASGIFSDVKLKRAGANNVIMPDRLGGIHMAMLVIQPDVVEFVDNMLLQGGSVSLEEIPASGIDNDYLGETIGGLLKKANSGVAIIGIKSASGEYLYNPPLTDTITGSDKLFVLGSAEQVENLKTLLRKRND